MHRKHHVSAHVTPAELATLKTKAEDAGWTISEYVRRCALGRSTEKLTAEQALWNHRCGQIIRLALGRERARQKAEGITDDDAAYELSMVALLKDVSTP